MCAESALRDNKNAGAYEGRMFNDTPFDAEMEAAVQPYLDQIRAEGEIIGIEVELSYESIIPDLFGTLDCARYVEAEHKLIIDDLKTGKGVRVDANNNTQLLIYGLMAYRHFEYLYDIERLSLRIHQTPLNHYDIWDISLDELLAFEKRLHAAVEATKDPEAPRIPTEKGCRWCLARNECSELAAHSLEAVKMEFEDLSDLTTPPTLPPPVESLTDKQVAYLLPKFDLVKAWIKAIEDRAYETLVNGGKLGGYKLVAGRSIRKWTDEVAAAKQLEDEGFDPYERKLISVAQAEKLVGKKHFDRFSDCFEKPEGKPVLVPTDDKRPALEMGFEKLSH
jgi:hypothetical protein